MPSLSGMVLYRSVITGLSRRAVLRAALALLALLPGPLTAQRWYKGNLHVHSARSDGDAAPAVVLRWYRERDYHFVALTDHNQRVFGRAEESLSVPGRFLVLPGEEVTDRVGGRPVHLNGIALDSTVAPLGGATVTEAVTRNARAIRAAGGIPMLNHPNGLLPRHLRAEELRDAQGVALFEVCCADWRGGSGVPSTEALWDALLTSGGRWFGVAADDAHRFHEGARDAGTAWVMVAADTLTVSALMAALESGAFYATTGPVLETLSRTPEGIRLRLPEDDYGYRTICLGPGGVETRRDESRAPVCPRDAAYVRARVERSDGTFAWVQPVWGAP